MNSMNIDTSSLTTRQIYDKVCQWIDEGKIIQKSSRLGKSGEPGKSSKSKYYDVWKGIAAGELFMTSNARVIATDKDVRDEFQALVSAGRVMNIAEVTIYHPECTTVYLVSTLVQQGVLMKIDKLSSATLYVE